MPHLKTQKGITWNYEIDGEGPALVFVHGWGGDLRLWSGQSEYFSKDFQVIRLDLPGHGRSSWKKTDLPTIARDLEELFKNLNIPEINIVGSSLGGLVILQWFDLFPKRFKRIAWVGSLPKFLQVDGDFSFGLKLNWLRKLDGQLETNYPKIVDIFFRSLFTPIERRTDRYRYLTQFRRNEIVAQKDALKEFLNILKKEDLRRVISKIRASKIPIQILNGTDDYICSKESVLYLQQELPHSEVKFFQDCGHFPFLTRVKEFNSALETFLKRE